MKIFVHSLLSGDTELWGIQAEIEASAMTEVVCRGDVELLDGLLLLVEAFADRVIKLTIFIVKLHIGTAQIAAISVARFLVGYGCP
jgi:hypothetical protein